MAVETSHAGVRPPHFVAFVDEHCPQAPLASQAGVALGHWLSVVQAWQLCVAVLQTGAVPEHCAFETQATHVPLVVEQTGVEPLHRLAFVVEH